MTAAAPPPDQRASRRRTLAWTALAVAGAALAAAAVARGRVAAGHPPVLGQLPDFSLVERSGRRLAAADLRGRAWVADFIFTRCGSACPAMTARMARLRREAPPDLMLVTFTVDPAHDTPEALERYARQAGAGEGWLFVTGPRDALYRLSVEGFKLAVEEVPPERQAGAGEGPFLHSSHFVLVDGRGRVRGYYDSTDEQALQSLRRDLRAVLSEEA